MASRAALLALALAAAAAPGADAAPLQRRGAGRAPALVPRPAYKPASLDAHVRRRMAALAPPDLAQPQAAPAPAPAPWTVQPQAGLSASARRAQAALELSSRLTALRREREADAAAARRLQGSASPSPSASASPSASMAPTITRTPATVPSPSSPPANVTAGGPDLLEGVWLLQPGIDVEMYAEPNTANIVAFLPPWADSPTFNDDYNAWTQLQQAVTVTITARSGPGPVTLVLSSLLYYCLTPEDYRNFNINTGVCYWAGDGAPEEYWVQTNVAVGAGPTSITLTPDNVTTYPSPLYYGAALWVKVVGPISDTIVFPTLYTVRVDIAQLPTPSVSATPVYVPVPTPSPFPSGMAPVDGAPVTLQDGVPFQFAADAYAITYFYFPVVPAGGPLPGLTGITFTVTSVYNDAELWITPFAYNCTNQTYFNANWWDSTCSWAGDSFLPPENPDGSVPGIEEYWWWDQVAQGESRNYTVDIAAPYLWPNPDLGQTGFWIGMDSFSWGSPAVITITANYLAPPRSLTPSPSTGATPSPTPTSSKGSSGGGANFNDPTTAIAVGAGIGGAVILLVAGLVTAFVCRRRARAASGAGGATGPARRGRSGSGKIPDEAVQARSGQLARSLGAVAAASDAAGADYYGQQAQQQQQQQPQPRAIGVPAFTSAGGGGRGSVPPPAYAGAGGGAPISPRDVERGAIPMESVANPAAAVAAANVARNGPGGSRAASGRRGASFAPTQASEWK